MTLQTAAGRGGTSPNRPAALAVIYRALGDLKLNSRNPRSHSRRQIRQIARSIEAFGFNVPVLIDAEQQVMAGHGRVLACRELGWKQVPTISLTHLNDAQARAFMIADNRLTENSVWDDRLLAEQLRELSLLDLDFSLDATGFEMGEIDLRIEGLDDQPETDTADVLPEARPGAPVSKTGDLWLLGRHRVLCGSALSSEDYALLMEGQHADLVFTDPPYNVPIDGHVSGLGAVRHRDFAMASGEMSETQFIEFLTDTCRLLVRNSVPGSMHYLCMDWRHAGELLAAGKAAYRELKNICVWVKHNAGMGSLYRSQHELILVFKNGSESHRNNIQLGRYGRRRSNVWSYPGANCFGRGTEEGNLLALHPTVKPAQMVADAILDCSARGEVVLDPFLGSGTTLIASERTGRRCFGMEIDPLYVDTVIRRWQIFTGDQAKLATAGKSFAELEAEQEGRNV